MLRIGMAAFALVTSLAPIAARTSMTAWVLLAIMAHVWTKLMASIACLISIVAMPPAPLFSLFPYTTLFRSAVLAMLRALGLVGLAHVRVAIRARTARSM